MGHEPVLSRDDRARAAALAAGCAVAGLVLAALGLGNLYGLLVAGGVPPLTALYVWALAVLAGTFLLGLATGIGSES